MKAAIIGAGLAGTACAYVLKRQGFEVEIYEAGNAIAPDASGNPLGLYNPRLSGERTFYADAFDLALKTFPSLDGIEWNQCGSLHLITTEIREKRFAQAARNWNLGMRIVDAREASEIAGVSLNHSALWLPQAGTVSPRKLCEAYAQDVKTHFNAKIESLPDIDADVIILANGYGVQKFFDLKLGQVRGQITQIKANAASKNLKCNLCYGGYLSPEANGAHTLGATFQRWLSHSDIIEEDDADNIAKLKEVIDLGKFEILDHRAALRTTSKDHFPVIGHIKDNIYVSAGHGSHGILSSLAGAHIIAAQIAGRPAPVNSQGLQPQRFLV